MLLFTSLTLGHLNLKNRYVMAPVDSQQATGEGFVTQRLIDYYERRAQGGVGLIVVEATKVDPSRKSSQYDLCLSSDKHIPGMRELAEGIHAHGAKAVIQLNDLLYATGKRPADLSLAEIAAVRQNFLDATVRAREAGFDGVQFHMAHRYTLADFLSRGANKRKDGYGGPTEHRARLPLEIVSAARQLCGPDFALLCRINGDEFSMGGNTVIHSRRIAKMLQDAGADCIDVSAGGRIEDGGDRSYSCYRQVPTMDFPDAVNVHLAAAIKEVVRVPVIAVGKLGWPAVAEEVLAKGQADLIGLGRPLIADPDVPNKTASGRWDEIQRCIGCNDCIRLFLRSQPVECKRGELSLKRRAKKKTA